MSVETVTEARRALAHEGFVEELVADGQQLRIVSSGLSFPPSDLVAERVVRFGGITTPEEEAVLFGLATRDGRRLGTYVRRTGQRWPPRTGPSSSSSTSR